MKQADEVSIPVPVARFPSVAWKERDVGEVHGVRTESVRLKGRDLRQGGWTLSIRTAPGRFSNQ